MSFFVQIDWYRCFATSFWSFEDICLSVCYMVHSEAVHFARRLNCFFLGWLQQNSFWVILLGLAKVDDGYFGFSILLLWFFPSIKFIAWTCGCLAQSSGRRCSWSFLRFLCACFQPFIPTWASSWWEWTLRRYANEVCFFLLFREVFSSVIPSLSWAWRSIPELWEVSSFSTIFILAVYPTLYFLLLNMSPQRS